MNTNDEFFIEITNKLLNYIDHQDWEGYLSLVDENLSCIEPETENKLMLGLDFHKKIFEECKLNINITFTSTLENPHVKIFGNSALITYERILVIDDPKFESISVRKLGESRIWNFIEKTNSWKMVHFHKS